MRKRNPRRRDLRRDLVTRCRRGKAEIAQLLADVAYWNERHPEAAIDIGEAELIEKANAYDRMLRDLAGATA